MEILELQVMSVVAIGSVRKSGKNILMNIIKIGRRM
jgi:hypothetical protein